MQRCGLPTNGEAEHPHLPFPGDSQQPAAAKLFDLELFQEHFKEHSRQSAVAGAVIELSCEQCTRKFRYRKALDHHMKKAHSGQKKHEEPPTKEQKSKEQVSTRIKCDLCQKRVDSEWHLAPSRHNCPGITAQVRSLSIFFGNFSRMPYLEKCEKIPRGEDSDLLQSVW